MTSKTLPQENSVPISLGLCISKGSLGISAVIGVKKQITKGFRAMSRMNALPANGKTYLKTLLFYLGDKQLLHNC